MHVHACTTNASGCQSGIEFNMPWIVCMYASRSGLWLCILFYAIEAGRHHSAPSVCSLTLMLPRCPPGVYTQRFDDIIGDCRSLKWSSTLWTAQIENREIQGSKVCVLLLCWCGALLLASSRDLSCFLGPSSSEELIFWHHKKEPIHPWSSEKLFMVYIQANSIFIPNNPPPLPKIHKWFTGWCFLFYHVCPFFFSVGLDSHAIQAFLFRVWVKWVEATSQECWLQFCLC